MNASVDHAAQDAEPGAPGAELQALRLNQAIFQKIFESAPDAILVIDHAGRITHVNAQAEHLFSYAAGELLRQPVELLLPERFRQQHVEYRSGYVASPSLRPMGAGLELFGRRNDGTEFPVDIMLSPVEGPAGGLAIAVVRDITERKRFEQTLQEQNVELENANQAKDRFLASMSHELRTPLNAIIGFTGTLLMQLPGPLNVAQEKQLQTVQAGARELLALINDLLDLAKVESGKVEIHNEELVVQDVLTDAAAALRAVAEAHGTILTLDMPELNVSLFTHSRTLRQIVMLLGGHAIRFAAGGTVRLALRRRTDAGRPLTEISLSDNGRVLTAGEQAKLFEPFTRLSGSGGTQATGAGLGLYLAARLAALLDSEIRAASEAGKGNTLTLLLRQ